MESSVLQGKETKNMKKFIACFLLLSIFLTLVSCSESPNTEDMDFIYNGISSSNITSGGGKIYSLVQTPAVMVMILSVILLQ